MKDGDAARDGAGVEGKGVAASRSCKVPQGTSGRGRVRVDHLTFNSSVGDVVLGMGDRVGDLVSAAKEVEGRPEGVDDSVWREEARNVCCEAFLLQQPPSSFLCLRRRTLRY